MSVKIPPAGGVPGIPGPPDWLTPGGNPNLDDVRWLGAIKKTFGAGGAGTNSVRITQKLEGGQQYVYLSFRAAFAPSLSSQLSLSDQFDAVYLGLRKKDGSAAMVIRLLGHGPALTAAGPPSANPPANVHSVQVSTRTDVDTSWQVQPGSPSWIPANARAWLQRATDDPADPNNRWAIQVRVPANTAGAIDAALGPNIGTEFDMWYLIVGTIAGDGGPSPVLLGEHRIAGTTAMGSIITGNYPNPFASTPPWDRFVLGAADTFGGIAIYGNGSTDVRVWNAAHGEGIKIVDGANTFIARPRNYRPPNVVGGADQNEIAVGEVSATFRMANWGSVGGDPSKVNWASGTWDYVPGNSALTPVLSNLKIPTLAAGANPPATPANRPIELSTTLSRGSKSIHQCIFVTLSGANLEFLNDSTFQNMDFATASVIERDAEINVRGVDPEPRDVYIAVEKINMQRNLPPGTDNGRLLEGRMRQLMQRDKALGEKLMVARRLAGGAQEHDTAEARLAALVNALSDAGLDQGEFDQLFPTFRVHAYHDTGERITTADGREAPVYRAQSSFGLYAYHEGQLTGWATSIQGARRTADNLYHVSIPSGGVATIKVRVQAVEPGETPIAEDPIIPGTRGGCLAAIRHLLRKMIGS